MDSFFDEITVIAQNHSIIEVYWEENFKKRSSYSSFMFAYSSSKQDLIKSSWGTKISYDITAKHYHNFHCLEMESH